jgi:hypothetical protein
MDRLFPLIFELFPARALGLMAFYFFGGEYFKLSHFIYLMFLGSRGLLCLVVVNKIHCHKTGISVYLYIEISRYQLRRNSHRYPQVDVNTCLKFRNG